MRKIEKYIEIDLLQDTKSFLGSEYGVYIMSILSDKADGLLSSASDLHEPYPDRYIAKLSAIKEVIDLINSPLDDDKSARG